MTLNIVPLAKPDPDVMELLRQLTEQAQSGEIISLVFSAELQGGRVRRGHSPIKDLFGTIGQLERMKFLLLSAFQDPE